MTEIEKKALALVNEIAGHDFVHPRDMGDKCWLLEALCRAIEQHEAFRQEVSDVCSDVRLNDGLHKLYRFIIAKPDPMDLVADDMMLGAHNPRREWGAELRAAIEKRGGKIVWGEG